MAKQSVIYDLGRLLYAGGYKIKTDAYPLYRYIYFLLGMINLRYNHTVPLIRRYVHKHRHAADVFSWNLFSPSCYMRSNTVIFYLVKIFKNTVQIAKSYAMLCYVMLCLCCAMLCCVLLCYAVPCYAI